MANQRCRYAVYIWGMLSDAQKIKMKMCHWSDVDRKSAWSWMNLADKDKEIWLPPAGLVEKFQDVMNYTRPEWTVAWKAKKHVVNKAQIEIESDKEYDILGIVEIQRRRTAMKFKLGILMCDVVSVLYVK